MSENQPQGICFRQNIAAILIPVMAALLMVYSGCQRNFSNRSRTYSAKARVVSIGSDRHSIILQHEDIKGFMPAMTMSFPVKDPALLNGLVANDLVRFELTVNDQEVWVNWIDKTGHEEKSKEGDRASDAAAPRSRVPASLLSVGEVVPSFSLIDQDGHKVSMEDFRGKPLAITFIFTRCPLPDFCPRFTSHFVTVQNQLAARFKDRFHLLSITIDPAHDRPKVLKEYGRQIGTDFKTWSWLTGSGEEIKKVTAPYGVNYWEEDGSITHSAACAVITPSGKLYKMYRGNTWTPEEIVSDLTTLLSQPDNNENPRETASAQLLINLTKEAELMFTWEGQSMRDVLIINGLCLLIAVGALAVAAWALITGQVGAQGIDGLFLILICLFVAFVFSMSPLHELRRGALKDLLKRDKAAAPDRQKQPAAGSPRPQEKA